MDFRLPETVSHLLRVPLMRGLRVSEYPFFSIVGPTRQRCERMVFTPTRKPNKKDSPGVNIALVDAIRADDCYRSRFSRVS